MKKELIEKYGIFIIISIISSILIVFVAKKIINGDTLFYRLINQEVFKKSSVTNIDEYTFLERYDVHEGVSQYKKIVKLDKLNGNLYYIRGNNNLNIYRVGLDTTNNDKNTPILEQIVETMEYFESKIQDNFKNKLVYSNEEITNNSDLKINIPVEEKIYKEKEIYTKIYIIESSIYHINYYMDDSYFICELVKIL